MNDTGGTRALAAGREPFAIRVEGHRIDAWRERDELALGVLGGNLAASMGPLSDNSGYAHWYSEMKAWVDGFNGSAVR